MRASPLIPSLLTACLLASCQATDLVRPAFTARIGLTGGEAEAIPVAPAGVPGRASGLTVDVADFLAQLTRARRVLATVSEIARIVVTVTTADGRVVSQTLDRAALLAGLVGLHFDDLSTGDATVVAEAFDTVGRSLGAVTQTATVAAGAVSRVAIAPPPGGTGVSSGSAGPSGGGSRPPAPPATPTPIPAPALDATVVLHDGARLRQAPTTYRPSTTLIGMLWIYSIFQLVERADGDFWVLTGQLAPLSSANSMPPLGGPMRLGRDGTVQSASKREPAKAIALAGTGTLWAAGFDKKLRRYDAAGSPLGETTLPDAPAMRGLALDADGHAWVASGRAVLRYDATGALLDTHPLDGLAGAVTRDPASGGVWVVAGNRLVRFGADGSTSATSEPVTANDTSLFAPLAVDPTGTAWVGLTSESCVVAVRPDGTLAARRALELPPAALAVDGAGAVWVAMHHTVDRYTASMPPTTAYVARLDATGTPTDLYRTDEPIDGLVVATDHRVWAGGKDLTVITP